MARHARRSPGTFEERCAAECERLEAEASQLPHGRQRDELMRKAHQTRVVAGLDKWLSSPGVQPPTRGRLSYGA